MQRSFTDEEFKSFVLSDKLSASAQALAETLNKWKQASVSGAVARALAYLPKDAHIRAKVLSLIKPDCSRMLTGVMPHRLLGKRSPDKEGE